MELLPSSMVDDLLKDHSKGNRITFVNRHQEYPQYSRGVL